MVKFVLFMNLPRTKLENDKMKKIKETFFKINER